VTRKLRIQPFIQASHIKTKDSKIPTAIAGIIDSDFAVLKGSLKMAITDIADQYYTYDGRLASFQSAAPQSKRRTSNAASKAPKSIKWPHLSLPPEQVIAMFLVPA
jgi:hypothetical protein